MSQDSLARPRVSIGLPLYNGAAFLEECLRSIHGQTFEDFEVVIVDDGSTDAGLEIARRWAECDARFRIFVNVVNLGLVGNWNRCIELARGEWIKFVFQDDLMASDCLSRLLEAGERSTGFVACARHLIFADDVDAGTRHWYEQHARMIAGIYEHGESLDADSYALAKLDHLHLNMVGEPSVTMVRRRLFDTYGTFDRRFSHICDSEMWDRLGSNVGVVRIAEPLASFRIHAGAASAAFRTKPFRGAALDPMTEFYDMCYAPHFAGLRRVAERAGRLSRLRRNFDESVCYAFDLARTTARTDPSSRRQIRGDLIASTERLMGYRTARNAHALLRICRFLGLARKTT